MDYPRMTILNVTPALLALALISSTTSAFASTVALEMDADSSSVSLVSTKVLADGTSSVAELFTFDSLAGSVSDDGLATVMIDLGTINTGIGIRDERMAEFLFETGSYPQATITAQIEDTTFTPGNHTIDLDIVVDMHGKQMNYSVPVLVSADDSTVMVVTEEPLLVDAASFDLQGGLGKLGELAGLLHIPTMVPVTFSLSFLR